MASTRSDFYDVWHIYLWLGTGVFVFIFLVICFALVRFRARPGHRASEVVEHNRLEIGVTALLVVVAAFLMFITFRTEAREDTPTRAGAVKIKVAAFQWGWRFTYPGKGVTIIGNNNVNPNFAVPVGRPVDFELTSLDVVHAMWIPEQRFKKDAIPDKVNRFSMEFGEAGREQGHCTEFCGLRHANMGFGVWVLSPASYERWLVAHR